jgi:hypothetical protein
MVTERKPFSEAASDLFRDILPSLETTDGCWCVIPP